MKWIVSTLCISIIAFFSGYFLSSGGFTCGQKEKVKIVEKVEHKTEYIYVPTTPDEYKACFDSKIHIDAKVNDDIMTVFASDKCKKTETEFRLAVQQSGRWKYYVAGAFVAGALVSLIVAR